MRKQPEGITNVHGSIAGQRRFASRHLQQEFFELTAGGFDRTRIVHHELGSASFRFQRSLTGLPTLCFRIVPTASFAKSGQALIARHVDEHHRVAQIVPACFKKDGRIQQHGPFARGSRIRDSSGDGLPDFWMNDSFQVVASRLLFAIRTENDLPQRFAIDLTVRVEHGFAKPLADGVPHCSIGQDLMSDLVAVYERHVAVPCRHPTGD
jgi:hypothetical protein